MNIFQRLAAIREEVSYLKKDAKILNYKALTHDHVTAAVRPSLLKHGVICALRHISTVVVDTGKTTSSGVPYTRCDSTFEIDWINIDEPEDRYTVSMFAMGEDNNDKGPGKAASYAMKMAILKTLSIESGDREEDRVDSTPAEGTAPPPSQGNRPQESGPPQSTSQNHKDGTATTNQVSALRKMGTHDGMGETDLGEFITYVTGVSSIDELSKNEASKMIGNWKPLHADYTAKNTEG